MSNDIKVARLVTGETIVFEEAASDASEGTILLATPFCVIGTPQGPGLAPMMPWVSKGVDYHISLRATDIMFYFPEEHCEPLKKSYIAATSRLDLSAMAGVSPLQR